VLREGLRITRYRSASKPVLYDVGAVDDFPDARPKLISVEGREIGLIRWHDEFFAVRNICPHQAGPVAAGAVRPKLSSVSASGRLEVDQDCPVLSCPWHGWEFELRSGRSITGHPYRVGTYPVHLKLGRVLIELGAARTRRQVEEQPSGESIRPQRTLDPSK
jgi:nitrite reductase/ring-hydroxylating ferredoxin subunit